MGAPSLPSACSNDSACASERRFASGALRDIARALRSGASTVIAPLAPLALSGAMVGCASPTTDGPDAEATAQVATAVVVVERTTGPGESVRGDDVVARFMRVRHGVVDDQVLRMTGVALDVPAIGSCSSVPETAVGTARTNEAVELLDVGSITFGSVDAAEPTLLLPRTMPDPTGLVSGVVYSAHASEAFTAGGHLDLRASGGPDLASGFSAAITAPADIEGVRVLTTKVGLDISWEAVDDTGHDVVYVEVANPTAHVVTRCATLDGGRMLVPPGTLEGMDEGTVTVHRLHRESARTKEMPVIDVRFDVARIVTFRR